MIVEVTKLIRTLYGSMDSEYIQENDDKIIDLLKQAAHKLEEFKDQLEAATQDIQRALWSGDEPCSFCKYQYRCDDTECDKYIEGVGMIDENGNCYDWQWSCRDFEWGTCAKLENTPCNGCDLINHFEWKGR